MHRTITEKLNLSSIVLIVLISGSAADFTPFFIDVITTHGNVVKVEFTPSSILFSIRKLLSMYLVQVGNFGTMLSPLDK
jgi:hypothetical protein